MILTFCGHSDFRPTVALEKTLLSVLEDHVGNAQADFFLGGYGNFDTFAFRVGQCYQKTHPNVTLVFVTPYLHDPHFSERAQAYGTVLYPPLESVPPRFAISRRNKYMVEKSDLVIGFITRSRGGAYQTYDHAVRKGKKTVNLAEVARASYIIEQAILSFDPSINSTKYFARHILCYMREHQELMTHPDYRRLYAETLDYLVECSNDHIDPAPQDLQKQRNWMEFLLDLENKYADERFERFPQELIERYLDYRRAYWQP